MTNPMQPPLYPPGASGPVTPAAAPSDPAGYASVTPHGRGPAPYNIQQDNDLAAVAAAFAAANRDGGQGVLYPGSERQAQAKALIESPAGFGSDGYDVDAGTTAGWPANIGPGG